MNFKPDLVLDEQRYTGWTRTEIYGDGELGRALIPAARKLLGGMRSMYGINARQAYGPSSGYYSQHQKLPGGHVLHVMSNDGQDTMRIYTSRFLEEQRHRQRLNDIEVDDYMWVGIRVKDSCTRPWFALEVLMIEPDGSQMTGIIGTQFSATGAWGDNVNLEWVEDGGSFIITPAASGSGTNTRSYEALIDDIYDTWIAPGSGFGDEVFSPGAQRGDHAIGMALSPLNDETFTNDSYVLTSVSGLMLWYWVDCENTEFGPYDPLMSPEQNLGQERDFSLMDMGFFSPGEQRYGWDAVFMLDAKYAQALRDPSCRMVDRRPMTQALLQYMKGDAALTLPEHVALGGNYKLVVRAYDTPPERVSSRAGQDIEEPDVPNDEFHLRSASCDYDEYMEVENNWPPLEVEVQVRLGRMRDIHRDTLNEPDEAVASIPTNVFTFDLTCAEYDDRDSVTWPFGSGETFDECLADGGPNMGGPSYSSWIDINVKGLTATAGGSAVERVVGGGTWVPYRAQIRRDARFFIYGGVFPQPTVGWEHLAAHALFVALESVTAGVYGCSEMSEMSEASLEAMFSGTSYSDVHVYDPVARTLTTIGPPATLPADWAANDPPDDSTNFFWYYENAVPYKNECFNTYGVLVTSVGGFYEMSQNFVNTPGYTEPDCC